MTSLPDSNAITMERLLAETELPGRELLFRNSSLGVYHECHRKFWWSVVLWLNGKKKATPLILGGLVHLALEHLQGKGVEEALAIAEADFNEQKDMMYEGEEERIWPVVVKLIKGYAVEYANDQFTTLQTEYPFNLTLPNGKAYRGKIDKLVSMGENYFIMEHKTSGQAPATFFKSHDRGRQITGYFLGATKLDLPKPVMGVVVDALFKPRINKGGLGPVNFQRDIFTRGAFSLNSFVTNTTKVVDEILGRDPKVMEEWPENEDSCHSKYGSTCPYIDLCKYGQSPVLLNELAIRSPYPPNPLED